MYAVQEEFNTTHLNILEFIPDVIKEQWNAASEKTKQRILKESMSYVMPRAYDKKVFWLTRDFDEKNIISESEYKSNIVSQIKALKGII